MTVPVNPPPQDMPQSVIDFRTRTFMPKGDVDLLWASDAGYLEAAIAGAMANITARLRKRYVTPFTGATGTNPTPEIVVLWMTRLVTPQAYLARGFDPADPTITAAIADRDAAIAEIKEAADEADGLYDLPLLDSQQTTGITFGGPLGSADISPYDWIDTQADALNGRC